MSVVQASCSLSRLRFASLGLLLAACGAPAGSEADGAEDAPGTSTQAVITTMRGADVSSLQRTLDLGGRYYDAAGTQGDALDILKGAGVNYVRLRVWNSPASGYNNKAKVLQSAKSAKAKGLGLLVDLHYSDTWADPNQQNKPGAWSGHAIGQLETDVYNYTFDICNSLKAQGTTPDSMQIGNEINVGMLWNDGKVVSSDFTNLARLLKAGYNAVKACNASTQVFVHISNAGYLNGMRWFYDGIKNKGVSWDVTALSYYCYWHGTPSAMQSVVADAKSRYGKPVVIVETAYPFTQGNADSQPNNVSGAEPCSGYPATWRGQADEFNAVQNAARAGGASGVFYWEPTWYAIAGNGWDPANIWGTGDSWDNQAAFDWGGKLNPYIRWSF